MPIKPEDLVVGDYYKLENQWVNCDVLKYKNTNYNAALKNNGVYYPHTFTKDLGTKDHLISDAVLKRLEPCIKFSELVEGKKYYKYREGAVEPVYFIGISKDNRFIFSENYGDTRCSLNLIQLYTCISKDLTLNLYSPNDLEVYKSYKHEKGYVIEYLCKQDTISSKGWWNSSFKPKDVEREECYLFANHNNGEYEYLTAEEVCKLRKETVCNQ